MMYFLCNKEDMMSISPFFSSSSTVSKRFLSFCFLVFVVLSFSIPFMFLEGDPEKADFFTNGEQFDRSLLLPYDGPVFDFLEECQQKREKEFVSMNSGKVYASINTEKFQLLWDRKNKGEFTVEDLREEILPVFGHAMIRNQINWEYDFHEQKYTFFVPFGEESFWSCYFETPHPEQSIHLFNHLFNVFPQSVYAGINVPISGVRVSGTAVEGTLAEVVVKGDGEKRCTAVATVENTWECMLPEILEHDESVEVTMVFPDGNTSQKTVFATEEELSTPQIFSDFGIGVGGSTSFPFVSESNPQQKNWVGIKNLISATNISEIPHYQNIKNFDGDAFEGLQKALQKSSFFVVWIPKGWHESWFSVSDIQGLMDLGYTPVFNYWYFGDHLVEGMPNESSVNEYIADTERVSDFLAQFEGQKLIIMEPEFNKNAVVQSADTQHRFSKIIANSIDILTEKNPEILVSLSMTDTGRRGMDDQSTSCGFLHCGLGDVHAWGIPDIVFQNLSEKLDFISFHQMLGQFSRDPQNPGTWDMPLPKRFTEQELGIEVFHERTANMAEFLHTKYGKPVFLPYVGIMTATWDDSNGNNRIEDEEIDPDGWVPQAEQVYKGLVENKNMLQESGLFGFAPMAIFDNPQHDKGGYQYFMNNEYHLGIVASSAQDAVDVASNGDIVPKGNILNLLFEGNTE